MSKAFKCDKCKKCFDPLETGVDGFVTINEYTWQTAMDYRTNTCGIRRENRHLCPECADEFFLFMEGPKNEDKSINRVDVCGNPMWFDIRGTDSYSG